MDATATPIAKDLALVPRTPVRTRSYLLPTEHGTYPQLLLPMLATVAIVGVTATTLLLCVMFLAGFVATEPLRILLGHRGVRAKSTLGTTAWRWLIVAVSIAMAAFVVAWHQTPSLVAKSYPAFFVWAALGVVLLLRREKTAFGEVLAAVGLSAVALPLAVGAGKEPYIGAWIAAGFGFGFASATIAVRQVIAHFKSAVSLRNRAIGTSVGIAIVAAHFLGGYLTAPVHRGACLAAGATVLPLLAASAYLRLRPPHPRHLRQLGWILAVTASVSTITCVALFHRLVP